MINWPPRLNLARLPTPVTRVERFPGLPEDVEVWVKRDELTGLEVSGNKIRKLEFSLAEARRQQCDTVITCGGLQSNHCRTTAVLGARLGLNVHLLLRGDEPPQYQGNLLMDHLSGARVSLMPAAQWGDHEARVSEICQDYAQAGHKAYYIPVGASDEVGLWGYIAACEEIKEDLRRLQLTPDYIVCATGSGGTQGGLLVGARLMNLPGRVVAFNVSDDAAYFEHKINHDVALWEQRYSTGLGPGDIEITTLEGYLGPGYGIATEAVFSTIRALAASDGLFLDPVYTGKAFHGMVSELAKGDAGQLPGAKQVLFIHTGGLFGLFPQHEHFKEPLIN